MNAEDIVYKYNFVKSFTNNTDYLKFIHHLFNLIRHQLFVYTKNFVSIYQFIIDSQVEYMAPHFATMKETEYCAVVKFFVLYWLLATGIHIKILNMLKKIYSSCPTVHHHYKSLSKFKDLDLTKRGIFDIITISGKQLRIRKLFGKLVSNKLFVITIVPLVISNWKCYWKKSGPVAIF